MILIRKYGARFLNSFLLNSRKKPIKMLVQLIALTDLHKVALGSSLFYRYRATIVTFDTLPVQAVPAI